MWWGSWRGEVEMMPAISTGDTNCISIHDTAHLCWGWSKLSVPPGKTVLGPAAQSWLLQAATAGTGKGWYGFLVPPQEKSHRLLRGFLNKNYRTGTRQEWASCRSLLLEYYFKKASKRVELLGSCIFYSDWETNSLPEMETHAISLHCIWIINVDNLFCQLGIQEGSCWHHVWHHNASSF